MVEMILILIGKHLSIMKHSVLYFVIVSTLVTACSIQEKDFETPQQEDVIFYASFEQPSEETKVYANENLYLRWTADDRVSIFNKITYNQQYKFTGETGDNSGGFQRVDSDEFVTGNSISHVVSVYPYQEGMKITEDEVLTVTLPAEQHYARNTFGLGDNTMVSVSEDNVLQYKNVGGYLRISLYGEGVSVCSITLRGNNGEKLAGKATVTMPIDGTPSATLVNNATGIITLICDTPVTLGSTAEDSKSFWFVVPPLTFSKGFTIIVTKADGEVFMKSTSKSIVIERSNLSKMSPMEVVGGATVPEAIDLGLPSGLKWASFNLGASKPEEYGDYYAWGEVEPHYESGTQSDGPVWKAGMEAGYNWASYKWCMGLQGTLTKYCSDSSYGYNGFTDNKTVLDSEDDAASMTLGGKWRMPTAAELTELRDNCSWEWTSMNGINGSKVTGPNGNSIFLPAAGNGSGPSLNYVGQLGYYWSSSLDTDCSDNAWRILLSSLDWRSNLRFNGFSVRPVYGDFISVESVSLSETSLTLTLGETEMLNSTLTPTNATVKTLTWTSSDTSVATVSPDGIVTAVSVGTATITVWASDGEHTATCNVVVKKVSVPEAIDLGLPSGLKWASFNLGASKPEEYGDYYAWGETDPYYSNLNPLTWEKGKEAGYDWPSYRWCMGSYNTLTKYCPVSKYENGYNGFTDTKTVLDLEDDAANVNLGDNWRMPTDAELTELREKCSWEWTSMNGIDGSKVIGPNGNSIFLPAAGNLYCTSFYGVGSCGILWSSSLDTDHPNSAWSVTFTYSSDYDLERSLVGRPYGYSVRPVCY